MKFTILSAEMDLFAIWSVKILISKKTYLYRVSGKDYQSMAKEYGSGNHKAAINILLKGSTG